MSNGNTVVDKFIDSLDPSKSYTRRDLRLAAADFMHSIEGLGTDDDVVVSLNVSTPSISLGARQIVANVKQLNKQDWAVVEEVGVQLVQQVADQVENLS